MKFSVGIARWSKAMAAVISLALAVAACGVDVTVSTGDAGGAEQADEPAPTSRPEPEPTATALPVPQVPSVPSATPTPTPQNLQPGDITAEEAAAALFDDDGELTAAFYECAVPELLENPGLVDAVFAPSFVDFDDLSAGLQSDVIDLGVACFDGNTFATAVVAGIYASLPPSVTPCFAEQFDSEESRRALVEFGLAEDFASIDPATLDVAVTAIAACIPVDVWIETILDATDTDEFGTALDLECVNNAFADPEFTKALVRVSIGGDFETSEFSAEQVTVLRPFLDCIDIGGLIVAEALADGLTLSVESATCISDSIRDGGLFEAFFTGDDLSGEQLGILMLGCLTPEELAQLAAS